MREYLWKRRQEEPDRALWQRARKRAADRGIPFDLPFDEVVIPPNCPVLGIPLKVGGERSPNSPSLDRIIPKRGYVSGNVRVISDRANRLKSDRDLQSLRACAAQSSGALAWEFRRIAEYVEREALLSQVRAKSEIGKRGAREWLEIAQFLNRVFSRGQLVDLEMENDQGHSDYATQNIGTVKPECQ
jgi:hypothetical protein